MPDFSTHLRKLLYALVSIYGQNLWSLKKERTIYYSSPVTKNRSQIVSFNISKDIYNTIDCKHAIQSFIPFNDSIFMLPKLSKT